jgi:hypothetical protein
LACLSDAKKLNLGWLGFLFLPFESRRQAPDGSGARGDFVNEIHAIEEWRPAITCAVNTAAPIAIFWEFEAVTCKLAYCG